MMYNKKVQDCFYSPRHVGVLDTRDPLTVSVRSEQVNQSSVIDLYLHCDPLGRISNICFKTNGNPFVIAALEWISRMLEGQELDKLPEFNYQLLIKELEIPLNQYPVALQVEAVYKEILVLMKKKFEDRKS